MSRRSIAGSRAIITGASSGIGLALARELSTRGAHVILTARREERLEKLAAELASQPGRVLFQAGDITDSAVRQQLIDMASSDLGGLDLLINNAGVGAIGPYFDADEARLRQVMEVNFFAAAELIRAASGLLRQGRTPMIVNISSVLGHRAVPGKSEYCASKFAMHGLSDALRAELAPLGIDLLLVSPSTTESEFFDSAQGETVPAGATRGAMTAQRVAVLTARAIERGKQEIILSNGGKLLVWLDRLSPPLMNRLIARFTTH